MNKSQRSLRQKKIADISKVFIIPSLLFLFLSSRPSVVPLLIAGLICGWVGDIAIIFPVRMAKGIRGLSPILIGLLAFLAGHVFYSILFLQTCVELLTGSPLVVVLYLPYLFYGLIITPLLRIKGIKMVIIFIYIAGISFMSFSALLQLIVHANPSNVLIFAGSLFFLSSDTILGIHMLGKRQKTRRFVMGSYITAQLFFVVGYVGI